MNYRPEIDGLRAIAVLPVILYHGKFSFFQGGFVGVDIFFVISGFLITRIILSEIFQSSFSIVNFYERRARRILPALFAVLIFSTFFAWQLLPPNEFKDFGQSLMFTSAFSSNILFWLESGYFNIGTDLKPLIHTWSLGIEEQFYILFPLFTILIYAISKRFIFPFIFLIFFISLYLAQIYSAPDIDATVREAAFFLLPTRAWELLLGSILFLTQNNSSITSKKMLNNLISLVGLLLICYSIIFFSEATPFPSLYALIPTVGAALVITFGIKGTVAYRLLTIKPMIFIGLISYSAYLWHQPLLALSRYYFIGELSSIYVLFMVLVTLLLAYLSWRFIEQPFRDKKKLSRINIFVISAIGSLIFGSIGLCIHLNDGFKNRYNDDQKTLLDFRQYKERAELYRNRVCFLRDEQDYKSFADICKTGPIYIWGDSHAAGISYGMRTLQDITQLTSSGCPPILDFKVYGKPYCNSTNEYIFNSIGQIKPKIVFLSANWVTGLYKRSDKFMVNTFDRLSNEYPSVKFYVLGGLPHWFPSLPNTMLKADQFLDGQETYLENQLFSKIQNKDRALNDIIIGLNKKNLQFI